MSGSPLRGALDHERSGLDAVRERTEEAARAYRRARRALWSPPARLRASRAELLVRREALAAELERVGGLACPTAEAAAPLAVAFRAASQALEESGLLARGGKARRRPRAPLL